jgi:hypothetical protein
LTHLLSPDNSDRRAFTENKLIEPKGSLYLARQEAKNLQRIAEIEKRIEQIMSAFALRICDFAVRKSIMNREL